MAKSVRQLSLRYAPAMDTMVARIGRETGKNKTTIIVEAIQAYIEKYQAEKGAMK